VNYHFIHIKKEKSKKDTASPIETIELKRGKL